MHRPFVCYVGCLLAIVGLIVRFSIAAPNQYSFTGPVELSRVYQDMLAWRDVSDIAMLIGAALAMAGWLVPPRRKSS